MKRFGKKVYDGSNDIKSRCIGACICPVCQRNSRRILRKGGGFQNVLSVCDDGHTCELAKEIFEKYQTGDRVRLYGRTFGKKSVIRLDSYYEGVIIKSYPHIIDYQFDFKVDKCVMNGNEIKAPAWVIGSVHHGISHSSTTVKLLKKAWEEEYEQLSLPP